MLPYRTCRKLHKLIPIIGFLFAASPALLDIVEDLVNLSYWSSGVVITAAVCIVIRVELLVAALVDAFMLASRGHKRLFVRKSEFCLLNLLLLLLFFVELVNRLWNISFCLFGSFYPCLSVTDCLRLPKSSLSIFFLVSVLAFCTSFYLLELIPVVSRIMRLYASLLQQSQPFLVSWNFGLPG